MVPLCLHLIHQSDSLGTSGLSGKGPVVPHELPIPVSEQANMTAGTWLEAVDLMNVLFLILIRTADHKVCIHMKLTIAYI